MTKQMTFEEAKQKVAEKYRYENMLHAMQDSLYDSTDMFTEAAALWQQSHIDRIAFLERLSENFGAKERELKSSLNRLNEALDIKESIQEDNEAEIKRQDDRIKELEEGLKQLIKVLPLGFTHDKLIEAKELLK